MATIKITGVPLVENGRELQVEINGHRRGLVFGSVQGALEWIENHPLNQGDLEELLFYLAIRIWKARDPTFSNFATAIRNKTITVNPDAAANIVTIA